MLRHSMSHRLLVVLFAASCSVTTQDRPPDSPLLASFAQYQAAQSASPYALQWVSLGPVLNSARVESVQGDPKSPGTIYAAFGSGNLWKTTNDGLAWRCIFEQQSAIGIGDIALSPCNSQVLWLGSGESLKKPRNFTMPGTGVFLSQDGGESWRNVGLHDSWHIGEIAAHPTNPDIAVVAVLGHFWSSNESRGVYRTADAGKTWQRVLHIDEHTGAVDVVIAPSQPNVLYASMWQDHPGVGGATSGVHRSVDGGQTWARLRGGLPEGPKTGRIGLAVSATNADKVYAFIDNLNREQNPGEVYRSLDGGQSWQRTHEQDLEINSRIGWYFSDCYLNPQDDDEIYALGVRIAHSTDGGQSFELIAGDVTHRVPSPAQTLHLDHCEMWIDPMRPDRLILGNDGGLYTSQDGGRSWLHHNNLAVGEFYDIAVDNGDPYLIYGGVQDNASVRGPARERRLASNEPDAWEYVWLDPWCGGDGCYTVPDLVDPDTVYFSSQHGGLRRKHVPSNRSKAVGPGLPRDHEGKLQHNFIAPYLVSAHDHRVLYHGGNFVMRSPDRGDSWRAVSPDLSQSKSEERKGTAAGALAESPTQAGLLYCGTDRGAFWVTKNDGEQWLEHSEGLPPFYIRSICASRFVASRVYVTVTGLNYDDLHAHVFASEDHGATWSSIRGNLPDEVAYAIAEDPRHEDVLYAAMYRGVYVSTDRGESWSLFGRGMPGVAVADLVIQERELDLIAATHGRGIYRMNLAPLHWLLANERLSSELLSTPTAYRPRLHDTTPRPRRSSEERVPITFYLIEKAAVTVTVTDSKGATMFTHEMAARRGLNQFRWDLVTARRTSPKPYFLGQVTFLPVGTYQIRIAGSAVDLAGPLKVVAR
ncbi:MAG: photosystem II stability/assembly factor-like uncharacterized protein [Planctomycetota bacterium]|jgi:photosystem II stability/assembly factor-like uncharacterized protein